MKTRHKPVRTCRGCGRQAGKSDLARFVLRDGVLREDEGKLLPGRGVYCCRNPACRERLLKRQAKRNRK